MNALFANGRPVQQIPGICPRCHTDNLRNGACSDPGCDYPKITKL